MNPPDEVALAIKYLRLKLGLTQPGLGKILGLTALTIFRYEHGHVRPKVGNLLKLEQLARDHGHLRHAAVFRKILDAGFCLPRYCFSCGVYLMSGATQHEADCEILALIEEAME